ncbi:MAG: aspartyl protease [Verrucomicrobia bacterium]|nr:aspartyl protease [Verrucomicrobiota bacterium]
MGLTHQQLIVKESHRSRRKAVVKFLIDSGAVYSLVPTPRLRRLGIEPHRELEFVLADGTTITRKVGDAYFEFRGEGGAAPVIFGEAGDKPLLGATTLESLGLVLNPFKRQLVPMRLMLAGMGGGSARTRRD